MADVTMTWSSQTMGELQPRPGISVFHATFSVSLHVSGRAGSSAMTPALGPRNLGHWSVADRPVRVSSIKPPMKVARFIVRGLYTGHLDAGLPADNRVAR